MVNVIRYGTDSSGRPIYMSAHMRDWWRRVVARLGFEPTIVQGAWMSRAGGGAAASAGYHDYGGCLDLRTWNLTAAQQAQTIRVLREMGAAAWRRDARHGMDPHIHFVLGSDPQLSNGAAYQWRQYLDARDGLARNGRDYEWRPSPLVTTPPADQEDDMPAPKDFTAADWRAMREGLGLDRVPVPSDEDRTVPVSTALSWAWRHSRAANFQTKDLRRQLAAAMDELGIDVDVDALAAALLRQLDADE